MSPARKRSSAFDDFPGEEAPSEPAKITPSKAKKSAAIEDSGIEAPAAPPQVERIERLRPSQMMPDRFQPRHLLPGPIRRAFFSGQIDCYQAANEWISISRTDTAYHNEVERLLMMGESFEEHGQIKPITGSWSSLNDGRYIFVIETGERRFWAACLKAVSEHQAEEPLLRVETIQHPTRQRQVLENRHAEPPSAVGQACEVAALILAELEVQPDPTQPDEFEYFRQARAQRMPAGLWERITPIMQLTRPRMVQLLNILQMTNNQLDLADRYRLPERVLREILLLPREHWDRTLRLSIQNQLTSDEIADLTNPNPAQSKKQPHIPGIEPISAGRVATGGLRRFTNVFKGLDDFSQTQVLDEIADALMVSGQAEVVLNLLNELSRLVDARLKRK